MSTAEKPSPPPPPALVYLHAKRHALESAIPTTLRGRMTIDSVVNAVGVAMASSPNLAKCSPDDVYLAVNKAVRKGLDLENGEAFLVPYYESKTKAYRCNMQIGYLGAVELAMRTGLYEGIVTEVVHENDEWALDLANRRLSHCPAMKGDRGDMLFAYARLWLKGQSGDLPGFQEVMLLAEFEKIKDIARTKNNDKLSPAYTVWPKEMWRRSVLRRCLKRAPKSRDLLADLEDGTEQDEPLNVITVPQPAKQIPEATPDFGQQADELRREPEKAPVDEDLADPSAEGDADDGAP